MQFVEIYLPIFVPGPVYLPAIEWYSRAWQSQSEWVQFHHLCYWELMWANW